jgi:undecaprenyl-diphosphatase
LTSFEIEIIKWLQLHRLTNLDAIWIFISTYTTAINLLIVLFAFYLFSRNKSNPKSFRFLGIYLGLFISQALLSWLIKNSINRIRPFEIDNTIDKLSTGGSPSFPSGHTMETFAVVVFFGIIFPKLPFKWVLLIWALCVAYSRIVLGVHYLTDILGAAVLGGLIAFRFYKVFNKHLQTERS